MKEEKRIVAFISDVHAPYHDRQAIELALAILSDVKPDSIFFGGDIIDCYAVSDFNRDPVRVVRFQDEFDATRIVMKQLLECGHSNGYFLPGNHEARWQKTLYKHPELVSLRDLSIRSLLRLDSMGLKMVDHGSNFKIGELFYMHGDEVKGGTTYPARQVYLKQMGNIIFGHYHRAQVFYNRLKDGTCHGSWANPCLCELKLDYIKGVSQWQQGFSLIYYYDEGLFRVEQVVFFRDGKRLYGAHEGKLYKV